MTAPQTERVEPVVPDDPVADGRLAGLALLVLLVVTVPLFLYYGRDQSFFLDEWEFLVNRELRDVDSLLRPHNGHWVTLPAIAYRLQFRLWGITAYWPYQLAAIVSHLGVVATVWLVMRRLGVRGWIATLSAVSLLLYGSARENILFGFQITLTGSVLLGLGHLLLADHDGPFDRRDAVGVALGAGSLMCSAIGIPMAAAAGVFVVIRRGWRMAAYHVVPLAALYLVWLVGFGDDLAESDQYVIGLETLRFTVEMARATFAGLGQQPVVSALLGATAVFGLVVGGRLAWRTGDRCRLAFGAALLTAFLGFAVTSGAARVGLAGVEAARSGRYIYVAAACLLPFVAVGTELLARRRTALAVAPLLLLAAGLPGNVDGLATPIPFTSGTPDLVAALGASPQLATAPADQRLLTFPLAPDLGPTVSWLRASARDGHLPDADGVPVEVQLLADGMLGLHQDDGRAPDDCPVAPTARLELERGEAAGFRGIVGVAVLDGADRSLPMQFDAARGSTLTATGPLTVEVTGVDGGGPLVCDDAGG